MKYVICLLICAAAFAFGQNQPVKFRGAYLGQPLSDYADCSSGKAKALEKGWKTHGDICHGKLGLVYRVKVRGIFNAKSDSEVLRFENEEITNIQIDIPNDDWEKIRFDLTSKLGEPLSEVPQVYQNLFGARWEFNRGVWRKGDLVAFAEVEAAPDGACLRNSPCTTGIRVTIMSAEKAEMPDTKPNSLD